MAQTMTNIHHKFAISKVSYGIAFLEKGPYNYYERAFIIGRGSAPQNLMQYVMKTSMMIFT